MALEDAKNQIDHAFTRADLKGLSFENVFSGAPSFLRRRYGKDLTGVDIAVTGIPFDQAVTNRPARGWGRARSARPRRCRPCDPPYGWDGIRRWRNSRSSITATWPSTMRTRPTCPPGSRPMRRPSSTRVRPVSRWAAIIPSRCRFCARMRRNTGPWR
jgi:hypothetical protein